MIVGKSEAIRRAVALAEKFAPTSLPILLVGATGTGKELFAQHIHQLSGRKGPLVDVNCGALPRDMVESLFFGHCRGAFTGASESTVGHIERSNGGTLFLDELTSLPQDGQVKLLRVLETREVQPLGSGAKVLVDLRVVAAVDDGIAGALKGGSFRRDLYQRLAGAVIELPPLAMRPDDVVPLAEYFARPRGQRLEPGVDEELLSHCWPGNVRELRFVIERVGELMENGTISRAAVKEAIRLGGSLDHSAAGAIGGLDVTAWWSVCERHNWDVPSITRAMGIGRATLHRRLREVGISIRAVKKSHLVSRYLRQTETTRQTNATAVS